MRKLLRLVLLSCVVACLTNDTFAQFPQTTQLKDRFYVGLTDEALSSFASNSIKPLRQDIYQEALWFRRIGLLPLKKDSSLKGVYLVQVIDQVRFRSFRSSVRLFRYVEPVLQASSLAGSFRDPPVSSAKANTELFRHDPRKALMPNKRLLRQPTASVIAKESGVAAATPLALMANDPLDTSQSLNDITGANIRNAWDFTTGDNSLIVAVLSTGINLSHPDLVDNLWKDPNPDVTDFRETADGFNVFNSSTRLSPNDDQGLGTFVSGIIGAKGNNGIGIAGVAWNVKLMPVRIAKRNPIFSSLVDSDISKLIDGISYVLKKYDEGHKIVAIYSHINFTSDPISASPTLRAKIDEAASKGILFVTAAGDIPADLNVSTSIPGHFENANLISVGAYNDLVNGVAGIYYAPGSNFGNQRVHLAAPAQQVTSCGLGTGYPTLPTAFSATAGAYVAGVAVLIKAYAPSSTWQQIKAQIIQNVRPYPDQLADKVITAGVLDAVKALGVVVQRLDGDFNNDGQVDGADMMLWQRMNGQSGPNLAADGNHDGAVNELDLKVWQDNFGHTLNPEGIPGDYNQDGTVDGADMLVWQRSNGLQGSNLPADGNQDGKVDEADLDVWRAHFGETTSAAK